MRKGFTLIELLIAIGIFSIVVAIGIGGFVQALHTQREVADLISAQSNASAALEQMTREIRTGDLFCDVAGNSQGNPQVVGPCRPNGSDGCQINGDTWTCNNILDFQNAFGAEVDYHLSSNGTLERAQSQPGAGPGTYVPITSNNVKVVNLSFTIFGNQEGDQWPPRITISMGVVPNSSDPAVTSDVFQLQTTVSARDIDCSATLIPPC